MKARDKVRLINGKSYVWWREYNMDVVAEKMLTEAKNIFFDAQVVPSHGKYAIYVLKKK